MDLHQIKRPHISLVKLVEATGILLDIPLTDKRSAFKVPSPTNYDETVYYLSTQLYDAMNQLVTQAEATLPNEIAFHFYSKVLEPGFDYENALLHAGLMGRELFNMVHLILNKMQSSRHGLPIHNFNVMCIVGSSRASYAALETAAHIFSHGRCIVASLSVTGDDVMDNLEITLSCKHSYDDLVTRCQKQYHLPSHSTEVVSLQSGSYFDVRKDIKALLSLHKVDLLVLSDPGIAISATSANIIPAYTCSKQLNDVSEFTTWACWQLPGNVLLTKTLSRVQPFSTVLSPRVFLVCVKDISTLRLLFASTIRMLRPGDSMVLTTVVKQRGSSADDRVTRYDSGARSGWITGEPLPNFPEDYSEEYIEKLRKGMEQCISDANITGRVRLETLKKPVPTTGAGGGGGSIAEVLCKIAVEEFVDVLVVLRGHRRDVIDECFRKAPCSVAIIKS